MSSYDPCNFEFFMEEKQKTLDLEENNNPKIIETPKINNFYQNAPMIYKDFFKSIFPNVNSKEDIHKYILEVIKREEMLNLNEKYVFSLFLSLNKHLLTKEIIEDILEEELHLVLMKWLRKEKKTIKEPNFKNPDKLYIYLALLINIINLYELFPIKSSELCQFHLYEKLFKLNNLIKLSINNSFPIFKSLNNLLKKWKKQIDCFNLSKTIKNFILLNKKTKRKMFKETNDNIKEDKEKSETDADSDEKEELKTKNKKNKKKKKVVFNLEKNQIFYFNKDNILSSNLNQNSKYDQLV